jgi:phage terminase small subunit
MTKRNLTVLLKDNHRVFADAYLVNGNASESARIAGCTAKSPGITGYKWLNRPDVQAYLDQRREELLAQSKDMQTRVLEELESMAFANIGDFIRIDEDGRPIVDFSTATPDQLRAITSVASKRTTRRDKDGGETETDEVRFNMADKYRGLELLGKHVGMFKEAEQRIVVDVADRLLTARRRFSALSDGE